MLRFADALVRDTAYEDACLWCNGNACGPSHGAYSCIHLGDMFCPSTHCNKNDPPSFPLTGMNSIFSCGVGDLRTGNFWQWYHQIRGGFMVSISMFWLNFFARFLNRDPPIAKFLARGAYAAFVIHPPFVVVLLWLVWLVCGIGNPWKHASGYWYNSDGYPDGKGTQWSSATQQVLAFIFVSVAGSVAIWLAAGRLVKMERLKDII